MPESMRAARLLESGSELQVQEIPIPNIGANDVLVRIAACGTQDGDHMLIQGKLPLNLLPLTIGHEPAGVVAQVGTGVRGVKEGDRIFVDPSIACGNCQFCHAGTEHYCAAYGVMGMTHFQPQGAEIFQVYGNGGFAEYMKIPGNNVRHLPDDLPFEQAAKLAFLGVSLKGVERTRLKPGETIVISGASGALGTCAVMAANALGAGKIIAIARDPRRLERICKINPQTVVPLSTRDDPELTRIRELTGGLGADCYVDCLPAIGSELTQTCLFTLRKGGRAALIGGVTDALHLPYQLFMLMEVEITGSVGFGRGNFDRIVELMRSGVVDFSNFVTHEFPLEQANDAIMTVIEKKGDPLGVIVKP